MRIALTAPPYEAVPPAKYGGAERVVAVLADLLVRHGHEVTLFASGDSCTSARLVPCCPRATRLDPDVRDPFAYAITQFSMVYERANDFDVIHNHTGYAGFPFARATDVPSVLTIHGRLDQREHQTVFRRFAEQPVVAISRSQRSSLPDLNWVDVVHNGIDMTRLRFQPQPGDYLIFLGRICPEKRPDRAIAIAEAAGMQLIIAAKVDPVDQDYYRNAIAPLIKGSSLVEYVGEVDDCQKDDLLGRAYATLFPIDWPEPFGLTQIESMATGTPVIAMRAGSVEEIIENGVTGFVCDSVEEMVVSVGRVGDLERRHCRDHVARHFSGEAMTGGYERVYEALIAARLASR
jgi:glycosyltransferase involved in cell wall biosynthesis